jgi:uncharacterized membrane protein YkvA (DUF1232 family)
MSRLRDISAKPRRQIRLYRAVATHPRTPRLAKWCLLAAAAYAVTPIDVIPDFIPVLGHLDDLVIIPAFVGLALWLIPVDVVAECRASESK